MKPALLVGIKVIGLILFLVANILIFISAGRSNYRLHRTDNVLGTFNEQSLNVFRSCTKEYLADVLISKLCTRTISGHQGIRTSRALYGVFVAFNIGAFIFEIFVAAMLLKHAVTIIGIAVEALLLFIVNAFLITFVTYLSINLQRITDLTHPFERWGTAFTLAIISTVLTAIASLVMLLASILPDDSKKRSKNMIMQAPLTNPYMYAPNGPYPVPAQFQYPPMNPYPYPNPPPFSY